MSGVHIHDIQSAVPAHIRVRLVAFGVLLLVPIMQATVLHRIKILNVMPDILLVLVVIMALTSPLKWTLVFSYTGGVIADIFGIGFLGLNTLIFTTLGFLTYELSKKFMIETQGRLLAVVLLAVIFKNIITALYFGFLGNPSPPGIFLLSTCIGSIYSAAIAPLIARFFKHIN